MSKATPDDEKVLIELPRSEALVLFELLARWSERCGGDIQLEHQAEQRVLWNIATTLESALAEPCMPDYAERLAQARRVVQDTTP